MKKKTPRLDTLEARVYETYGYQAKIEQDHERVMNECKEVSRMFRNMASVMGAVDQLKAIKLYMASIAESLKGERFK